MVIPHVGVVGKSGTGKTSLVVELFKKLSEEGYNVATVKHTKGDFSVDSKGTDTFKHGEAGAKMVVFSTPSETSFILKNELELDETLSHIESFGDYDLVLIEGMKEADIPKITTDKDLEADIQYDGEIKEVIDWIEIQLEIYDIVNRLPKLDCGKCGYVTCYKFANAIKENKEEVEGCEQLPVKHISIRVNGQEIPLGNFPSNIIKESILAMVKSLKKVENIDKVEVSIINKEN